MNAKLTNLKTKPRKPRVAPKKQLPAPKHPQQTPSQVNRLKQILPKGAPTGGENAL